MNCIFCHKNCEHESGFRNWVCKNHEWTVKYHVDVNNSINWIEIFNNDYVIDIASDWDHRIGDNRISVFTMDSKADFRDKLICSLPLDFISPDSAPKFVERILKLKAFL